MVAGHLTSIGSRLILTQSVLRHSTRTDSTTAPILGARRHRHFSVVQSPYDVPHVKLAIFALGNFKAIGAPQVITFKPITLLFGANSAGKSSVLQALLLIRHALETGDFDAHEVTAGGEHINLGGIARMLHQHRPTQDLSFALKLQAEAGDSGRREVQTLTLGLTVGLEDVSEHVPVVVRQGLTTVSIEMDGTPLVTLGVTGCVRSAQSTGHDVDRVAFPTALNWEHPALADLLRSRTKAVLHAMGREQGDQQLVESAVPIIAEAVRADLFLEQADLLRGVTGRAQQFVSWDLTGDQLVILSPPAADLRYLYALVSLMQDDLDGHFQTYVRNQPSDLHDLPLSRLLAPGFFRWVLDLDQSTPIGHDTETLIVAMTYVHDDDHALVREHWAAARDASRLIGYLRDDVLNIILDVFQAAGQATARLGFLGPLRTVPERQHERRQSQDGRWQAGGGAAWQLLGERQDVRKQVNDWMSGKLGMTYEVRNRRLFDETVIENRIRGARSFAYGETAHWFTHALPEVLHEQGWSAQDVENLWSALRKGEMRRRDPLKEENHGIFSTALGHMPRDLAADLKWLDTAPVTPSKGLPLVVSMLSFDRDGYKFSEEYGFDPSLPAAEEVLLYDTRHDVHVGARDVGLGVSQVLPVLVNAAAGQQRWLLVEQPELHLHPALQAELGDIFIESVHGRGHTFVLETHSEHVILRLLRRIRETSEGEAPAGLHLSVDDLAVLYARPTEEGTVIETVEISPDGDFVNHWPAGFFADRSKELF